MSAARDYESRTETLLAPFLSQHGLELYDVEFVKEGTEKYLRAYIDRPGGVTINDCELVSRFLSDELDKEDFIPEAYILEVSSPGLGRLLKKDRHLEKSIGQAVEGRLFNADSGKKEFSGSLEGFDKDSVTIKNEDGNSHVIERKNIASIRLSFDF